MELTTDGLFLTLGKIIPPFLDIGLEVVPFPYGIVLAFCNVAALLLILFILPFTLFGSPGVVVTGYVVVGIGGSVKSSNIEYLNNWH